MPRRVTVPLTRRLTTVRFQKDDRFSMPLHEFYKALFVLTNFSPLSFTLLLTRHRDNIVPDEHCANTNALFVLRDIYSRFELLREFIRDRRLFHDDLRVRTKRTQILLRTTPVTVAVHTAQRTIQCSRDHTLLIRVRSSIFTKYGNTKVAHR